MVLLPWGTKRCELGGAGSPSSKLPTPPVPRSEGGCDLSDLTAIFPLFNLGDFPTESVDNSVENGDTRILQFCCKLNFLGMPKI
jgi:hypothetical protein